MRALRPIMRHPRVQTVLCWLIAQYIRLLHWTGNWTIIGKAEPASLVAAGKPFILAFWHGRLLMIPYSMPRRGTVSMLISSHPDGQLIARTVLHFNIVTIAGSTSKGGASAIRGLVRVLRNDGIVGITPDGPRGPYMRASDGVAALARISGLPVYPVTFSASRGVVLGSWDRFFLPFPFSRGVFVWGAPVQVPRDATPEIMDDKRKEIESGLNDITAQADKMVGAREVKPAPAEPDSASVER
jgi:lysophospholipid acyltransferase (LPLAT)-like uncharacterized protein